MGQAVLQMSQISRSCVIASMSPAQRVRTIGKLQVSSIVRIHHMAFGPSPSPHNASTSKMQVVYVKQCTVQRSCIVRGICSIRVFVVVYVQINGPLKFTSLNTIRI